MPRGLARLIRSSIAGNLSQWLAQPMGMDILLFAHTVPPTYKSGQVAHCFPRESCLQLSTAQGFPSEKTCALGLMDERPISKQYANGNSILRNSAGRRH
jgi:hypothetical protein